MAAAADEDKHHIQAEDTLRREGYHGRDMIAASLQDASSEWKRRQQAGGETLDVMCWAVHCFSFA